MHPADFLRPLSAYALALLPFFLLPEGAEPLTSVLLRGVGFLTLLGSGYVLTGALAPRDYRWLRRVARRSMSKG